MSYLPGDSNLYSGTLTGSHGLRKKSSMSSKSKDSRLSAKRYSVLQSTTRWASLPSRPNIHKSQSEYFGKEKLNLFGSDENNLTPLIPPCPQWPLPSGNAIGIQEREEAKLNTPQEIKEIIRKPPQKIKRPPQRPPRPANIPHILESFVPGSPGSNHAIDQLLSDTTTSQKTRRNDSYVPVPRTPRREKSNTITPQASAASSLLSIPEIPSLAVQQSKRSPHLILSSSSRMGPFSFQSHGTDISPIKEESGVNDSVSSMNLVPPCEHSMVRLSGSPLTDDNMNGVYKDLGFEGHMSYCQKSTRQFGRQDCQEKHQNSTLMMGPGERARGGKIDGPNEVSNVSKMNPSRVSILPETDESNAALNSQISLNSSQVLDGVMSLRSGSFSTLDSSDFSKTTSAYGDQKTPSVKQRENLSFLPRSSARVNELINFLVRGRSSEPTMQKSTKVNGQSCLDVTEPDNFRSSATSLPDLILRATRLASNLDRGRTASQAGFGFLANNSNNFQETKNESRSQSVSDILAAFPPPGLSASVKSPLPTSRTHSEPSDVVLRRRRICGTPVRTFVLLAILLFFFAAAAAIIPPVFLNLSSEYSTSTSEDSVSECQTSMNCENGGRAVTGNDSSCSCICLNGFSGDDCSDSLDQACTTTDVNDISNVTLGSEIPSVFSHAEEIGINMDTTKILSLFSSAQTSCSIQNTLVTFMEQSHLMGKRVNYHGNPHTDATDSAYRISMPTSSNYMKKIERRQETSILPATIMNIDGVFMAVSVANELESIPTTTAPTSPTSTSTFFPDAMLHFACVGVLLKFQLTENMETAVTAHTHLQSFFNVYSVELEDSMVNIGDDFMIDFGQTNILQHGEIVGVGAS